MATVADQLRCAREQQKLTVYQVADSTKIKTEHIRALESGDYQVFSAPVYIRGFVRSYAKALKLDHVAVLAALDAELSQNKRLSQAPSLTPQSHSIMDGLSGWISRLNHRFVIFGLGVVLIAAVTALALWQGLRAAKQDPLKKLGPGLYQPAQGAADVILPIPASPPPRRP